MSHHISVLLIDDDPAQCETLGDILADQGCDCTLCTDPHQGAALGASSRFDLVLLDLKMAGLSGLELLRRIRPTSHGCILVLTGIVEVDVKRAALAAGANAVLDKPVDISRLLEITRDVRSNGDCKVSAPMVPVP